MSSEWKHPLLRAADPANNRLVRLFRLEPPLNPFVGDRVIIDAAVTYGDLANIKMVAAFYMLAESKKKGFLDDIHTIVEPTSGNFGTSIGLLAPAFGVPNVVLYIKKDAPPSKIHVAEALPAVSVFKYSPVKGQPTGLLLAQRAAEQSGVICLNQYGNWLNVESHFQHTGPAIWKATKGAATVLVAATGSGGTLAGAGMFLKKKNPKVVTVRAVVAPGEEIAAGRTLKQMEEIVTIAYEDDTFNFTMECGKKSAHLNALRLGGQIHAKPGPTSGQTHHVTLAWVAKMKRLKKLDQFRNKSGEVHIVEIFADSIDLYAERITGGTNYEDVQVAGDCII